MERYILLGMLGEGTFATCWKGKHRESGQVSTFTEKRGREARRVKWRRKTITKDKSRNVL
jgi:hypothetical protein